MYLPIHAFKIRFKERPPPNADTEGVIFRKEVKVPRDADKHHMIQKWMGDMLLLFQTRKVHGHRRDHHSPNASRPRQSPKDDNTHKNGHKPSPQKKPPDEI